MKIGPVGIDVIMLAIGVAFWLASLNLGSKQAKLARTFQSIAIWIFIATIGYKAYITFS